MFTNLATLFSFGLLLGLQHALDADHIAAVSTLIMRAKSIRRSAWLGVAWGIGHTFMLLVAGSIIIFFKLTIPPAVADMLERVVGIVLIVLGIQALYQLRRGIVHTHEHNHGQLHHTHAHSLFFLGLLHGLAGSSAVTLLVLSSVKSAVVGIGFLLIFGIGSIIGMALTSAGIGLPLILSARCPCLGKVLHAATVIVSIVVGIGMAASFRLTAISL